MYVLAIRQVSDRQDAWVGMDDMQRLSHYRVSLAREVCFSSNDIWERLRLRRRRSVFTAKERERERDCISPPGIQLIRRIGQTTEDRRQTTDDRQIDT